MIPYKYKRTKQAWHYGWHTYHKTDFKKREKNQTLAENAWLENLRHHMLRCQHSLTQ